MQTGRIGRNSVPGGIGEATPYRPFGIERRPGEAFSSNAESTAGDHEGDA
jgi:hypothetical protein